MCRLGRSARLRTVEVHEAMRRRTMVRSFREDPVDPQIVERIVRDALRSPTAGNTQGTAWVTLLGPAETAAYWSVTTDAAWRARNARRYEGMRRADAVLLAYSSPAAYVLSCAATITLPPRSIGSEST